MNYSKNEIVEISFEFALEVIEYAELLEKENKYIVAGQVLKAGTPIAQASACASPSWQAQADACAISGCCATYNKEAEETDYWLSLCAKSKTYPDPNRGMTNHQESIGKLLNKIIATSKRSRS